MTDHYDLACQCGGIRIRLTGEPRVRGNCHCEDCRELLDIPYHAVTAWNPEQLELLAGADALVDFQHPTKRMKRVYCRDCGETLYNTNGMDWRVVSQWFIRRNLGGELPEPLQPLSHFYYDRRVLDIDDDLPKRS